MSRRSLPPAWSSVPTLAAVRAVDGVRRQFGRLRPTLGHTLHIASAHELLDGSPGDVQARFVPSIWGTRRDDYRWDETNGNRQDVAAFRSAASATAAVLHYHYRFDGWAGLLPGTMGDVLGTRSDLYLADYWVFVLHHLVWTGRLSYATRAKWLIGDGIGPGQYLFVSELPTDLTEASREALILFEEAVVGGPGTVGPTGSSVPCGLPIFRGGRWELAGPGVPILEAAAVHADAAPTRPADPTPVDSDDVVVAPAPNPTLSGPTPVEHATDGSQGNDDRADRPLPGLKLDDQTFTVRSGGNWYRFPPRGKQMFALLERVARRPGHRVDFDDLRQVGDVWDGSMVEDSTIRGAVARLRAALEEHEMGDLAARIKTGSYRNRGYVLLDSTATPDDTDD